ncbi:flavin-dependent oxidoreductase [Streptomyces tsukubensis]|uniref:Flavin-dependent oxidoreductase n=1 Tax=Streptomyces tsukubensis TaxID=83656 RepID=A0A1V4ABF6_9ACTN|nr:flavin-dependent oxidoreductase [Streptomyces tsukubensis]OON80767.1 flavin-dependent oxidoreductase [Streptomyces tsukubensis]QFR93593.1 flavin-dependent oxidoreductase [Streptomyces tsukubensis]
MPEPEYDVLVAGAGIGGLTTALSLHAAGIGVGLVEMARPPLAAGFGINLLPHAVRELTELGLGEALAATAVPTAVMVHYDRHGNHIWGEPRGLGLGYRWPQYSLRRSALHEILLGAVRARLGAGAVRTGVAVVRFGDLDARLLRVTLRDTERARDHVATASALIGADGLHSAVRAQLHPGEGPPLWNGVRMWRGTVDWHPVLGGRTVAVAGCQATAKLVVYPVSREAENRGGALLNWVAEVRFPVETGIAGPADWNRKGRLADILPHFAGWRIGDLDVPAMIAATPRILEYPMVDRAPLAWWGRGPVTLLGDAAHPMYPIGSNGGSQAVLDARMLALCLARAGRDREAGLRAYEAHRRASVNALVLANRSMPADRLLQLVAERAPGGFERVEDILTEEEFSTFRTAYRATTGTDAAELNARGSWSVY